MAGFGHFVHGGPEMCKDMVVSFSVCVVLGGPVGVSDEGFSFLDTP